ncbi:hypothetical protein E2C01_097025 [Portunus trituberculatus]|uniref:Uncharacterized protein n=1 Tax=Portunus trituberculatus TaxID=210409 RepID=A0A5B7JZC8_PORTR|nr:hypothetical protein [Portunus trituberculatus]
MPVDPVPRDTCVQFIAGSHLWPQWFLPRKFATEKNYPLKDTQDEKPSEERQYHEIPLQEIEAGKWPILQWECKTIVTVCVSKPVLRPRLVVWCLSLPVCGGDILGTQPGDVVIFHMRTLHGAKGNSSSSTHRRVLSTRWLG